ncbi:efflux RND transporter permease subunit [Candidatus Peregrinibacteria bacterium]|jgi:hydrophobic/amphiphilic exporter-1 (mainly G- bacteria), HAE1 family|nr:efflux RND transporter permease subunit [Candidatus Peregrinibacteria bacterium]MBT7736370.1 efflux RND transporter permease subunit [Candidatus Peregrinibacteria bacterium]
MTEEIKETLEKVKNSFWGFFIERRPVAWLVVIGAIIMGSLSLSTIPREIQPEVKIPFVSVATALPGANPTDVETLISIPLEDNIANIEDIEMIGSNSGFGFSSVFIEFDAKADMDKALQDVKDAVDLTKPDLPEDATDPIVVKAEPNAFSIITFSVTGNLPAYELTNIAESIEDELEKVSGVAQAQITGAQNKYIEVVVNQETLEGYGLDIQSVGSLIKMANNNLPVGIVSSGDLNYSVRIDNRFESIEDIRNLPLMSIGDDYSPILLRDIATIEETYPSQGVISRLSENGKESKPTISIQVFNEDNTNTVKVAEDAKLKIQELEENGKIPDKMTVTVSNDNSQFISEEIGTLSRSGMQTTAIITIILFLALGLRQGIVAGLSIPIIFMITFVVLDNLGMSLNTLSLFSLVIALGLMVDTTIVIMEGIHENIRKGYGTKESALLSVHTYKWPLIAGTLTTVFAFFPMLLVSGILGEFLRTLPITITSALIASLFISLTIAPSIATKFIKSEKDGGKRTVSILEPFFDKMGEKFHRIIEFVVQKASLRIIIVLVALVAFAASMSLPISGALKVEMFPTTDQNYFVVQIEATKGAILEHTDEITQEVENYLYEIPEIETFVSKTGSSQSLGITEEPLFGTGANSDSNLANITINLISKEERERKSYDIAAQIRNKFENFPNGRISIVELQEGPPSEGAINLKITGDDFNTLNDLANQVKQITENTEGATNIELSLKPGLNEFKFTLDKDILSYHGLSSIQVSALVRNIIQGVGATDVTLNGEDLTILVKYDLTKINEKTNISIHDIESFEINTPKGYKVALSEIGTYEFGQSISSIAREDQKRTIKVSGDTEKDINVVDVTAAIQSELDKIEIPQGYSIDFGGDLEDIAESFQDLFRSMFVAVILIAFTLVMVFNSFRQPLVILLTLPLALIGVFPGLMLVGHNLSFPAFLGVVALTGIVVNDAIVLIDRINKNRQSGMKFAKSIAEATEARLQPIIMTSITTIAGILPLALTNEFWSGLGFSLIFGLMASTALTLIVIPVLYFRFESRSAKKLGQF